MTLPLCIRSCELRDESTTGARLFRFGPQGSDRSNHGRQVPTAAAAIYVAIRVCSGRIQASAGMVQIGNRPLEPVAVPHDSLPAPVVDLESADAVDQVRQACTAHGFLYGEPRTVPA